MYEIVDYKVFGKFNFFKKLVLVCHFDAFFFFFFFFQYGLEGGGRVKGKLVELCDILVALRSASLDQYPLMPAARPPDDRRLAEIILTSHLQTLGSTVVVADSPNAANKV